MEGKVDVYVMAVKMHFLALGMTLGCIGSDNSNLLFSGGQHNTR